MIQLLLVDDEQLVLDGICAGIDWEKNGISKVFMATNIAQAKEILENNKIDILLCDIEMPGGNGLGLLAWLKETGSETIPIMLTCHADFIYCQQTMKLSGFDYILKPAPYEEILMSVKRAISLVHERERHYPAGSDDIVLNRNRAALFESLWLMVFNRQMQPNQPQFLELAASLGITFLKCEMFTLILVNTSYTGAPVERDWSPDLYKHAAAEKILQHEGWMVDLSSGMFLCIIPQYPNMLLSKDIVEKRCQAFFDGFEAENERRVFCYFANPQPLNGLAGQYEDLLQAAMFHPTLNSNIIFIETAASWKTRSITVNTTVWNTLLKKGHRDDTIQSMMEPVFQYVQQTPLSQAVLHKFVTSITIAVYSFIKQNESTNDQKLDDILTLLGNGNKIRSLDDLRLWVTKTVDIAIDDRNVTEREQILKEVKLYIQAHLGERIVCEDIARIVHLNSDYLARIFKKDADITILDYITNCRMETAIGLVAKTNLSISNIAQQVGYSSFSHFSKIFKQHTGMIPRVYRQKYQKGSG